MQYLPGFPKDPAVLKILRVEKSVRLVKLLSRCDLLSRCTLCGHHLTWFYRHFSLERRVHGVVKHYGVAIHYLSGTH